MSELYKPNIGQIITDMQATRDAIHIAIYPGVAGHSLIGGDRVSRSGDGSFVIDMKNPIGVVDPFLKCTVLLGQMFWVFLYPNTVENLRHVWEHPAFKAKVRTNG